VKTLPNLSHRCLRLCFNTTLLVALTAIGQPIAANDNDILGHELYSRKDYSSAAEVFDDPLWKGIALYRSEQWWRAAEAFVRGNDARSFHNLGNTYVKMGYYALALEAYQQALQKQPDFVEAAANAKIMRELIALKRDSESGQGLLQPESLGELEQAPNDSDTGDGGSPEGGENAEDTGTERQKGDSSGQQTGTNRATEAESGPAAHSDETGDKKPGEQGSTSIAGIESDKAGEHNAAGNSDSTSARGEARSAGKRTELEAEQATEQWLNRITHNPILYLQRHIQLETRRRRASGQQAPEGGNGW